MKVNRCIIIFFSIFIGINTFANDLELQDDLEGSLYARIDTNKGKILIRLNTDSTTSTVENFVGLAEGTKEFTPTDGSEKVTKPFYKDQVFYRVSNGRFIQSGCPIGDGSGGPGYDNKDERDGNSIISTGSLAMFASKDKVHGSQFILTSDALEYLNGKFPVIGQTIYGNRVIQSISEVRVGHKNRPLDPPKITHVQIIRPQDDYTTKVIHALNFGAKVTRVKISGDVKTPERERTPEELEEMMKNFEEVKRNNPLQYNRTNPMDLLDTPAETRMKPELRKRLKEERWRKQMMEEMENLKNETPL